MLRKGFTYLLSLGILGLSGGVGWGLMNMTTPRREDIIKKLPESDPKKMGESRQRSQEWLDAIKAAADNPNPIYKSFTTKQD